MTQVIEFVRQGAKLTSEILQFVLSVRKFCFTFFEFFLLRSGRLLIHPSSERRAIVLENVPKINTKETQIQELLRALRVQIQEHGYQSTSE